MSDIIQQLKTKYKEGEINVKLIFICVGVFLISMVVNSLFFRNTSLEVEDFFAAKPTFETFFSQPWGILTYTFFHGNFIHLALNMLMIYFIGQLFLRYFRKENFLTFFLFGSVFGALFYMIFSFVFNYKVGLVGASAAVYSLFFALIAYMPKTKIQLMFINIPISLDYVGYALIGYDLLMIISGDNVGGHISHIGGAAFGFLYMKQFEKGKDVLGSLIQPIFFRQKTLRKKSASKPPKDDYEFNDRKVEKQNDIDKILDKISRSGYESLTKEEKDFLFKAGR